VPDRLVVSSLGVSFGKTEVLRDLSFSVPDGATLAVIGPNGAGKTALFKALIGALSFTGTVAWAEGTRLGYVPQRLDLERDLPLSGRDFLHAKASLVGSSATEVERATKLVNLGRAVTHRPIGGLSGGQFQRLLLAFALLGHPSVLLFDEPTTGIDEPGEELLYATVQRLQSEEHLTVIFISHELSLVYRMAGLVLCLGRRAVSCFGPPRQILTPETLERTYGAPMDHYLHSGHGP
jgi:zinc transport system ATP-binding protein